MSDSSNSNVFSNKNFLLTFIGALISDLGAALYSFAISYYILDISDNNAFLQGLYLALCGVALVISTPIGGVLGDRSNKAKIMFICDLLTGSVVLISAIGITYISDHKLQLIILFFVGIAGNILNGFFSPAASALLPDIVEKDQFQQANAYFTAKSSLQSIIGVILAGILYSTLPVNILFMIVGICYIVSAISEMFIHYEFKGAGEKITVRLMITDMADSLNYLKSQKAITALLAASLFMNFFVNPVEANFVPYFIKTDVSSSSDYLFSKAVSPEMWSSIFSVLYAACILIGSLILSSQTPKEKFGHTTALRVLQLAVIMILLTLGYSLFVFSLISLNFLLIIMCLVHIAIGFVIAFINIPSSTAIMRTVDENKLSKITSFVTLLAMGITPISLGIAGAALQFSGGLSLLAFCSAGFAITAICLLLNKHIKEV